MPYGLQKCDWDKQPHDAAELSLLFTRLNAVNRSQLCTYVAFCEEHQVHIVEEQMKKRVQK